MSLSSLDFFLFFIIVFFVFWLLPKAKQWKWLLLVSWIFYALVSLKYFLLLLMLTSGSYLIARKMEKAKRRGPWLFLALFVLFLLLAFWKYSNFFLENLNLGLEYFGQSPLFFHTEWLLPLGVSFYTFQIAGYLIDIYRKKYHVEKNFGLYALFISFFPLISAGPIERGDHLLPQLKTRQSFSYSRAVAGMQLFVFGLFKKLVIADNLGLVVNHVFDSLPEYRGLSLLLAVFLFSWQLYFDFMGYTDLARGSAKLLGFDLLENFQRPYAATSLTDFWRRWHISLSSWFRDYLYISLGGNRKGFWRACLNVGIVFVLCGLWHGSTWNFVLWGAFHAVILVFERIWRRWPIFHFSLPKIISQLFTYALVCCSWVLFRAKDLVDAQYIYENILRGLKNFWRPEYLWSTLNQVYRENQLEMLITAFCLLAIFLIEWVAARPKSPFSPQRWPKFVRMGFYVFVIFSILVLRNADVPAFIYIQF